MVERNEAHPTENTENKDIKIENESAVSKDTVKYKIEQLKEKFEKAKLPQTKNRYSKQINALIEERNEMVVANHKLVQAYLSSIDIGTNMNAITYDDFSQAAIVGLIKGCERFSPSKGWKLSTYVTWWMKYQVSLLKNENRNAIHIPRIKQERVRQIKLVTAEFYSEYGRSPTNAEISDIFGITTKKVHDLMYIKNNMYIGTVSLDAPINKSEESDRNLADTIEDKSDWDNNLEINQHNLLQEFIKKASEKLYTAEEKRTSEKNAIRLCDVFINFFGLNKEEKFERLRVIGNRHNVSRERIRQIREQALKYVKADKELMDILKEIKTYSNS
jgi:RNA polymerase sigma factor (sigma-70 family)